MTEINYTITSADKNDYTLIRESLIAPPTQMTEFIVTGLTTMCSFVILDRNDFIEFVIYDKKESFLNENRNPSIFRVQWNYETTQLTPYKFAELMNITIGGGLIIKLINTGDLTYFSAACRFAIKDISYGMKLVLGMIDVEYTQRTYYFVDGQLNDEIELTKDDYLEIDGVRYYSKNISDVPMITLQTLINVETGHTLLQDGFEVYFNYYRRLMMHRFDKTFNLTDASVNMIKITGFGTYNDQTAIKKFDPTLTDNKYLIESQRIFFVRNAKERESATIDEKDYIILRIGFDSFSAGIQYDINVPSKYTIDKNDNITILTVLRLMLPMLTITTYDDIIEMTCKDVFAITNISKNLALVTGFVPDWNMHMRNIIELPTKGYFNLTPVLYLTSNIGSVVHTYKNKEYINRRILMRINNYYIQDYPIVCNNCEFSSIIPSNSLSDVVFQLVDANFQPVKLLTPMYLTAIAIPIPDKSLKYVELNE